MELRIAYFLFLVFVLNYSNSQGRLRTRPRHRDIRGDIEGNITGDTYSPDLTSVIPGSSSLAFVFDVTGSMWDDLKQVTAGAQEILDTTRSRAEQPLHNYVLIPFHDPGMYVFDSRSSFVYYLRTNIETLFLLECKVKKKL